MPKTIHDFKGEATVAEFRDAVGSDFLDYPNIPYGTKIYVRKVDTGCWHTARIVVEDSGVYIEGGAESNPQDAVTEDE